MRPAANGAVSQLSAQQHTAGHPISMYRFLRITLLRWREMWELSIARTVVLECCTFPRRIEATYKTRWPHQGIALPCDPRQIGPSIAFEVACSEGIQRLWRDTGFLGGPVDRQVYLRGFLEGARYIANNPHPCRGVGIEGQMVAASPSGESITASPRGN
jgi:hypothetical protein